MATIATEGTRVERLQQKGERVRREVSGLTAELEGALADFERQTRDQLTRRPYLTLTAATGIGYVLGGGVPTALSRMVFSIGGRIAFVLLAQRLREAVSSIAPATNERGEE